MSAQLTALVKWQKQVLIIMSGTRVVCRGSSSLGEPELCGMSGTLAAYSTLAPAYLRITVGERELCESAGDDAIIVGLRRQY